MITERQALERAIFKYLHNQRHTVLLTLKFDFAILHRVTESSVRRTLRAWDARTNRKLLGPKWHKYTSRHLQWDAFIEKIDVHPHLHLLATVKLIDLPKFQMAARSAWQSLRGTDQSTKGFHWDIASDYSSRAIYCSKEFDGLGHINYLEFK